MTGMASAISPANTPHALVLMSPPPGGTRAYTPRMPRAYAPPNGSATVCDEWSYEWTGWDGKLVRADKNVSTSSLLQGAQELLGLVLELTVFGPPFRVQRRVEDRLQFGACVGLAAHVEQGFGEEEVRGGALVVIRERLAQVL